jgi:hypothetical protein
VHVAASGAAALDEELQGVKTEKDALAAKQTETGDALEKSAPAGRQLDADLKKRNESLSVCRAKTQSCMVMLESAG